MQQFKLTINLNFDQYSKDSAEITFEDIEKHLEGHFDKSSLGLPPELASRLLCEDMELTKCILDPVKVLY